MRPALFFCAAAFHDGSSTELWEDLTDDEPLEIFYAEHLLATWTIDASPSGLKGSIGEGPNHSKFSDRSSVRILAKRKFC